MGTRYEIVTTLYATVYVEMRDASGALVDGLAHSDITAYATKLRSAAVAVPVIAIATPATAAIANRTSLGWVEVNPTYCKGLYRLDLTDALFDPPSQNYLDDDPITSTGYETFECVLSLSAAGCETEHIRFQFVANAKNVPAPIANFGIELRALQVPSSLGLALNKALRGYDVGEYEASEAEDGVPEDTVGLRLAADGADAVMVEDAVNLRGALSIIQAYCAGRTVVDLTGGTVIFKNPAGTATRISGSVASGARTSVTATPYEG